MIRLGSFLLPLLWVAWGCGTRKQQTTAAPQSMDTAALHEMYFAAEVHYIQGNWKQSDSLFRRYVRSTMPPGAAYHRLACIAAKNGRNDEALSLNAKARMADTSVEEWMWLDAELYRRKGEYKKAGDVFAAYTLKHPRSWTAYTDAVRFYTSAREWPSVLSICERWENAFGLMEPVVEARVQALTGMKQPEKAARQWAALLLKYPDRRYYQYSQVNVLLDNNAEEAAGRLLDTLMRENPQDPELLTLYCEINTDNAFTAMPPFAEQIVQTRGLSFESKWKCLQKFTDPEHPAFDSCEPMLHGLLKAYPKEPTVSRTLGLWCLMHGKAADAAGLLKQTLKDGRPGLDLWQQYLTALSMGCETQKMLAESDTLVEWYHINPHAYRMQAIAYLENGKPEEARQTCLFGELYDEGTDVLTATKLYINIQTNKSTENPQLNIFFDDSTINTEALMVNVEWALSRQNWVDATALLNTLFGKEKTRSSNTGSRYIKEDYWWYNQCVLQQARLALATQKNQDAAILLLKKHLPESPVALELMGDLYGTQDADAIACYERALLCTSYIHKDRLMQKINSLRNR